MSLLTHHWWNDLKHFLFLQGIEPRARIEVLPIPPEHHGSVLGLTIPCPSCGSLFHPIRARKASGDRSPASGFYYASSCSDNKSCSRKKAASDAFKEIKRALRPDLYR